MTRIARIVLVAALAPLAATAWASDQSTDKYKETAERIRALDTDGDGRLSRTEVTESVRLSNEFDHIDRNGDGYLQEIEIQGQDKANEYGNMKELTDAKFLESDTNNDGKISPEEAQKYPRLAKRFGQADTNKDGFVDKPEARAFRAKADARQE